MAALSLFVAISVCGWSSGWDFGGCLQLFLEKLLGVCKELIFPWKREAMETDRRIPVANTPGSQALTSLAASLPPHWAQILM